MVSPYIVLKKVAMIKCGHNDIKDKAFTYFLHRIVWVFGCYGRKRKNSRMIKYFRLLLWLLYTRGNWHEDSYLKKSIGSFIRSRYGC